MGTEFHVMNACFDQLLPHLNLKAAYEVDIIISFYR